MAYLEQGGSKATLIVFHGWCSSPEVLLDYLTGPVFRNYRIIIPYLPCSGESFCPKGSFSFNQFAGFCEDFLKQLNIKNQFHLIGHSLGGNRFEGFAKFPANKIDSLF